MTRLSTPGADAILSGVAMPATLYLQGHIGNPGTNGLANNASDTTRLAITPFGSPAPSLFSASFRAILNTQLEEMTVGASPAPQIWTYVTLWSASSGGTCWWIIPLSTTKRVYDGNTIRVLANSLTLALEVWT